MPKVRRFVSNLTQLVTASRSYHRVGHGPLLEMIAVTLVCRGGGRWIAPVCGLTRRWTRPHTAICPTAYAPSKLPQIRTLAAIQT